MCYYKKQLFLLAQIGCNMPITCYFDGSLITARLGMPVKNARPLDALVGRWQKIHQEEKSYLFPFQWGWLGSCSGSFAGDLWNVAVGDGDIIQVKRMTPGLARWPLSNSDALPFPLAAWPGSLLLPSTSDLISFLLNVLLRRRPWPSPT